MEANAIFKLEYLSINPEDNLMDGLFKQYERVIIDSIITSFGLDFFIKDRHGGDVDTVHNVRQIGIDKNMTYKNIENETDYNNLEAYKSCSYHSHTEYVNYNKEGSQKKKDGTLIDGYTGKTFKRNDNVDLDHKISANEIHNDRGRVLSGLSGENLANERSNLVHTNQSINRSKKDKTMEEYIKELPAKYERTVLEIEKLKVKEKLTEKQQTLLKNLEVKRDNLESANIERMKKLDEKARREYNKKIEIEYYSSSKFKKNLAFAGTNLAFKMGLKQALGLIFTEIWFSVKNELASNTNKSDLTSFLESVISGVKKGIEIAKEKYKEILSRFKDGAIAGVLSSITTTICNIFFTTSKNIVKIMRYLYVSIIQATKILFFNPDNLEFGERIRAVLKILATGASVIVGVLVGEFVDKLFTIPGLGIVREVCQVFTTTFVTGIMSCTLLHYLDKNEKINNLVKILNSVNLTEKTINYYREQARYFEKYAKKLFKIDFEQFKEISKKYSSFLDNIDEIKNYSELNKLLKEIVETLGIKPFKENSLEEFMHNKNSVLTYK